MELYHTQLCRDCKWPLWRSLWTDQYNGMSYRVMNLAHVAPLACRITQEVAIVHLGACAVGHCSWKAAAMGWYYEAKWRRCQVSGGRTVLGWLLGKCVVVYICVKHIYIHISIFYDSIVHPPKHGSNPSPKATCFWFSCSMFDHPTCDGHVFLYQVLWETCTNLLLT